MNTVVSDHKALKAKLRRYHCDDVGWIFYDRPKGRWLLREDKGEGAAANVGDLITAKREEKTQVGGAFHAFAP